MRILQFAFGDSAANPYLPHNHERRSVVYTGTHDNDTTLGWYLALDAETRARVNEYLGCRSEDALQAMVRAALASVAELTVVPLQDLLGLGSEARMNRPGTTQGNWRWSFGWEQIPGDFAAHWRRVNQLYGRA
jgi:4-alpha-glucanotransferase